MRPENSPDTLKKNTVPFRPAVALTKLKAEPAEGAANTVLVNIASIASARQITKNLFFIFNSF